MPDVCSRTVISELKGTWVIQQINQWEGYWISLADEIQLQSFYYTGETETWRMPDRHTLLSMVSRKRVRSSMAASQFCMRISDASLPQRELKAFLSVEGTWVVTTFCWYQFSANFHNDISHLYFFHIYCCFSVDKKIVTSRFWTRQFWTHNSLLFC